MSTPPKLQVAAKAVIVNDEGKVLLVRESQTGPNNTQIGKWGLIGGRLDPGETFLDGLKREVAKEVGLQVEPIRPLYVGEWHPVIRDVPHQIIAIFMLCKATTSDIRLSEEHDETAWVDPTDYAAYQMMDPDDLVLDELAKQPL